MEQMVCHSCCHPAWRSAGLHAHQSPPLDSREKRVRSESQQVMEGEDIDLDNLPLATQSLRMPEERGESREIVPGARRHQKDQPSVSRTPLETHHSNNNTPRTILYKTSPRPLRHGGQRRDKKKQLEKECSKQTLNQNMPPGTVTGTGSGHRRAERLKLCHSARWSLAKTTVRFSLACIG